MKTVETMAAQGDVMFRKIKGPVPKEAVQYAGAERPVIAHSETGHHHVLETPDAVFFTVPQDIMTSFVKLGKSGRADIVHQRPWDTHETIRLDGNEGDVWAIRRQREWAPEGWRVVED